MKVEHGETLPNLEDAENHAGLEQVWSGSRGRQGRHDVPFRAALVKVATAWYGDPAKYPWVSEYAAVKQWWGKRMTSEAKSAENSNERKP